MTDLLSGCMADLQTNDHAAFTETFCVRCRQPACERAQWSGDKFAARVSTQTDRLLRPERADPTSSRYQGIGDFQDMLTEALRLEVADRRGDWNVPEIPVTDGRAETAPKLVTTTVDAAALRLNKARGGIADFDSPELDDPVLEMPRNMILAPEDDLFAAPDPTPQGKPATVAQPSKVGAAQVQFGNTPSPTQGIMLGGPESSTKPSHHSDPWAVPVSQATVVKPGATIKMGGDK